MFDILEINIEYTLKCEVFKYLDKLDIGHLK